MTLPLISARAKRHREGGARTLLTFAVRDVRMQTASDDMSRRRFHRTAEYGAIEDGLSDEQSADGEGSGLVDFSSVALYVPGLQVTLALCLCCTATVAVSMASTVVAVSGVRTATVAALVATGVLWKPCYVSYARGVDIMFDALRPALVVYMMGLVIEQLVHSCGMPHTTAVVSVRSWIFYACASAMTCAGFVQARNPKRQTDYPFLVVSAALVVAAIFTPPPRPGEGPLCEPPTIVGAVERVFRALLFAISYCSVAYASEPTKHNVRAILLCAMRATTGSVWVLCVHRYLMGLAVLQSAVVTWARLRDSVGSTPRVDTTLEFAPPLALEYGGVDDYDNAAHEIPGSVALTPTNVGARRPIASSYASNGLAAPNGHGIANGHTLHSTHSTHGVHGVHPTLNGSFAAHSNAAHNTPVTPGQHEMAQVARRLMEGAES